ncbi:uncharacterized protein LOC107646882 [Arachis ipaensis]|uniref:uncharacterized protein LOC107646882 n=1 Tax=Arachis ipaensis TaxID=130454 RepID=UPI0007AF9360|nr:uncharacterized protein LOC107646882 [Arachis ipaensis]
MENDKIISKHDEVNSKDEAVLNKNDQEKHKEKDEQPQESRKGKQVMEESSQGQRKEVKTYTPPLPYPQRLQKELKDQQFPKFLEVFKKLEIKCRTVIQRGIPPKLKDPGRFVVSCTIGKMTLKKALCDLGASINLMPLSMMRKLAIEEIKPTIMSLDMADRSIKTPNRVVENLLVKVGEFIFPADFVI